jgi:hypothetical protein
MEQNDYSTQEESPLQMQSSQQAAEAAMLLKLQRNQQARQEQGMPSLAEIIQRNKQQAQ